jgi:hypothetical protein
MPARWRPFAPGSTGCSTTARPPAPATMTCSPPSVLASCLVPALIDPALLDQILAERRFKIGGLA